MKEKILADRYRLFLYLRRQSLNALPVCLSHVALSFSLGCSPFVVCMLTLKKNNIK